MSEKQTKATFLKQVKPIANILKRSMSNKTALLDGARIASNGSVLTFWFNRAPHYKKSLRFLVGQYGATVPLPTCLRGTAGDTFSDVLCCANYVDTLIKAVK